MTSKPIFSINRWRGLWLALADRFYVDAETGAHHPVVQRMGALSASLISYAHWPEAARHPLL